jgi:hypothetical protein
MCLPLFKTLQKPGMRAVRLKHQPTYFKITIVNVAQKMQTLATIHSLKNP